MDGTHTRDAAGLPHSMEAEQAVLGGLLLSEKSLSKIADIVSEQDFFRRDHRIIFRAISDLAAQGKPCDAVTLGEWFETQCLADQIGGSSYVLELASTTPSAANITAYADIVREKSTQRALIDLGTKLSATAMRPGTATSREIASRAAAALLEISGRSTPRMAKSLREIAPRWVEEIEQRFTSGVRMIGHPTPWAGYNEATLGVCPGDLIVIGARPSMGKSAWGINFATCTALRGKRVMLFSLEMTASAIFNRAVASIGRIPLRWLRAPSGEEHWPAVTRATQLLRDAPLTIDDTSGQTAVGIVAHARREHLRQPIDGAIIVDHLHLLRRKGDNIVREIGEDTAALKGLAKDLNVPVIVLAQLSRALESRTNKRPVMSDLRESGAIEQDADVIVFLYRDDYYGAQEGRASDYPGLVEMTIAKQREGEAGTTVWARNALDFGLLEDYQGAPPQPPARQLRSNGLPPRRRDGR
jgi:replicative DNA helicase